PLASITSSINNSEDLATSSRKRCSKLFLEGLFEERDLSLKHPKTHTHREIVCLVCSEDKRKTWLHKNDDSNTTNLWRHLERHHPDILDNQPFTTVENKHFQQMIKLLNPNATIPVGDTIRNDIIKSFEDESINIKCLLQSVPGKLSFAIDVWTSANIYSFFTITVHWISKDWKLQNILLDFINLHGPHSGENLCDAFVSSCREFGILLKIFMITSDNATNNDTFMQHLETICYNENIAFNAIESHCRCVAYVINLAVQDILKQLKAGKAQTENAIFDNMNTPIMAGNIILKLRKLVVKIRSSPQHREQFMRQVKAVGLENCNLILDIKTRWNSTYEMLVRALVMHDAIDAITHLDKDLQSLQLDIHEWNKIREIVTILEIFV
ncbi:2244_t:CDS:2, partial [Cetraspora pellucida]